MLKEGRIETISIYDEEDDLSYTAFIQQITRDGKDLWYGWFWEYPNISCETETKEELPEPSIPQVFAISDNLLNKGGIREIIFLIVDRNSFDSSFF